MSKIFKNRDEFLEAHKGDNEYYGSKNSDGTYIDHENFMGYKKAHPEDFLYPVLNGEIQGSKTIGYKPPSKSFEIPDGVKMVFYLVLFIGCVIFLIGYHSGAW